ncbi:PAS domain-containing protein [Aphanothece sacrum]|uniref:PAS/PAC domain-containing diguanylate cyclase/phosphodiesterase n=1 Tax=Aphanothece sacrum FPU1 TaxID=1920663 RepID=A0A401IGB4_APHSA|nr:PAS domain-containing protein [Aphanothece sacrum]GBF80230.1 PAS/PAC domain-containing diguanylate cyclase/phosphodiesterase [Aphanothece sacrum FPU1]
MKLQLDKLLDALVSNIFVLDNNSSFEKVSSQGELTIEEKGKKTDKLTITEEFIAQQSQENNKIKQMLEAKDQVIEQLKNPDNLGLTKKDFQRILEGVTEGLVLINDEGKVKFVNTAAAKLFARPKSELINYFLGLPIADEGTQVTIFRPGGHLIMAEMRVSSITWDSKTAYLASLKDVAV